MRIFRFLLPLIFSLTWGIGHSQFFQSRSNIVINPTADAEADIVGVNTTNDGYQVIGTFGDSNTNGEGLTIPTVASGTLYLWNGSGNTEITTQSVNQVDNTKGGYQQQFATDYKALTGFKTILVQRGVGSTSTGSWDGSGVGDSYPDAKTALDACVAFNGLTKPKYIIWTLGAADIGGGITNTRNSMIAIMQHLNTDYPGVPIIWTNVGRVSSTVSQSIYDIRSLFIEFAESYSNLHLCVNGAAFIGAAMYNADNIHWTQAGYNMAGSMIVRYISNKRYRNKWASAVMSSQFDVLSDARKEIVNYVITRLYNRGDYFKLESLHMFKTSTQNNIYVDWSFKGYTSGAPSSFSANTYTAGNGSSTNLTWSFISLYTRQASQTNFRTAIYLRDRLTADGTQAALYGIYDGTTQQDIRQTGSAVTYKSNDVTASTGTETSLTDAHWYGVGRSGGTKYIFKDKNIDASASVAAIGLATGGAPRLFAFNNNGSIANHISAQIEVVVAAPYTGFDWDSLIDDLDYYRANW